MSHRFVRAAGVAVAVAIVAVIGAGCSTPPSPTPVAPNPDSGRPPGTGPGKYRVGPQPLDTIELRLEPVARDLDNPLFVTHAGDGSGRLFVVEQGGLVRVVRDGKLATGFFLDVRSRITAGGERGLLGLAFAPDYGTSGRFYVNYTDTSGDTIVARFTARDPASDTPRLSGPEILLRVDQPYSNHNGGQVAFGPDGLLWIGMGDGGSGGDPEGNSQNPRSKLGKMLAMDVSADEPVATIMVSGVRNPWRFSFDRETGDLWIADVGQNAWEEINVLPASAIEGANLGWNLWEGTHAYPDGSNPARDGFAFPIAEYSHDEGRSITGGYVYRGDTFVWLQGAYLYADFEEGWIAALRAEVPTDTPAASPRVLEQRVMVRDVGLPASFGEDENGELYVCDWQAGVVYAIKARAAQPGE